MRVSVLDQSPISEGQTGADALRNTIELAGLADRLGYHRYWVAEHHGSPMLAGAAPEVLIGPIAATTVHIRVGSGGVMLPHYSPLKVAETFSVLAALFPGRIDLGLGRAAGTDPLTTFALQRDRSRASPDDFDQQLAELLAYLEDDMPDEHPFARYPATLPGLPEIPERWLLGSSRQSVLWAADLAVNYAFADFISPDGAELTREYRQRYAAAGHPAPARAAVAVTAICAPTDEEARYHAQSARMTMRALREGRLIAVPSPEKAIKYLKSIGEPADGAVQGRRGVVGDPATVAAKLHEIGDRYGAEEVIVVCIMYDHAARKRSYELIAEAMALDPPLDLGSRPDRRPMPEPTSSPTPAADLTQSRPAAS